MVLLVIKLFPTQEDWREIWDTLLKPFGEQRVIYRRMYKVTTAPDIFFGVEAKATEISELPDNDRDERADDKRSDKRSRSPHSTAISRVTTVDSVSPPTTATGPSERLERDSTSVPPMVAFESDTSIIAVYLTRRSGGRG